MIRNAKRSTHRCSIIRAPLLIALLGMAGMAQAQVVSDPTATVTGRAPTITAFDITGVATGPGSTFQPGDELTVTYTQADPDLDPADTAASNATIQWYSDGTAVGTVGSTTYVIQPSDRGKVISVRLVPHTSADTTDPAQGVETSSSLVSSTEGEGVITVDSGTTATSVAITGSPIVDQTLTAVPTCIATCSASITYQWQIESAVASGTFTDIAGATSNTYVVLRTDQRRAIKVRAINP